MASTTDPTAQTAQRAKQERLRENQRRSRARRQEYLVELEKRLEDCRVTCREANYLRESFQELQAENQHLRELLNHAGIGPAPLNSFLRRLSQQESSHPDNSVPASTNLRLLKPKLSPLDLAADEHQPHHPSSHERQVTSSVVQPNGSNDQAAVFLPSSCCPPRSQTSTSSSCPPGSQTSTSSCCPPRSQASTPLESAPGALDGLGVQDQPGLAAASIDNIEHIPSLSSGDPLALDWLFNLSDSSWENFAGHSVELLLKEKMEPSESNI
ncbi:hypothetical protein PV08_09308 [Exophiala spinifera]|uniref:BZIP domain-containing protein n=1 Tax=Exophiala spinifera TaxID=91928 RepID=A0A0D2BLJ2_9EURO|nr:uncharacterized protein PV08_09308 [Exophiala spinifera]KIW12034.1 hypothetical protein PV08_09308 [Exophiala spinifera]